MSPAPRGRPTTSTYDILRPIVPDWGVDNLALTWWRGDHSSQANRENAVVGLIINSCDVFVFWHFAVASQAYGYPGDHERSCDPKNEERNVDPDVHAIHTACLR